MAQNSFRPYKGKWLMKEYVMAGSSVVVEVGDLMELSDSDAPTVDLASSDADAIVGIAAGGLASSSSTQSLKVFVPAETKCEMKGKIIVGTAVIGLDINRMCDVSTHEGVDIDTKNEGHLYVVKVTKACASGTVSVSAPGFGIFRIANIPQVLDAGGWTR